MAKPATATWGTTTTPVQVEYLKTRRVLRLSGGPDAAAVLEVPLAEFCNKLGIDSTQLAPPRHFLLFAGLEDRRGGSPRHIVESFTSEAAARAALRALRRQHYRPADWAEAVSLDLSGQLRRLCWFGTPWGPKGRNSTVSAANEIDLQPLGRPWIRRWRRPRPGRNGVVG